MELSQATIDEIKLQARNGKTIAQIGKELKVDYWEVWNYAERSWQGTKWIITNRLNLLAKENDPETRVRLAKEANECVGYLFDQGKRMGSQIDRARKTLNE
ncbi:MAG: hypothetical protein OXL37_17235 [Chloroflexota bacterium]|nr:hypothetical protein [Chloroflexota bacterium]MDE2960905.1 hypothetical protein [Chloroflexota bacterium]